MTELGILLVIVVLIYLISINKKASRQTDLVDSLHKKMNYLSDQVTELTKTLKEQETKPKENIFRKESFEKHLPKVEEQSKQVVPEIKPLPEKKITPEIKKEPVQESLLSASVQETDHVTEQSAPVTKIREPKEIGWSKWLQNNPDMEKF